ncbi:ferredoxin reductase family protein [Arthrobacter sp. SDTb3-6]|uniref:ferredoxin reductase family protein n=1 Tax=Arthrobacter sp. SDTb3-6 TaxID=2713571 RepID=UPI00159D2AAA|nr:ferredoxin reductase family protein [Arthrobacter sp. SDTb3-6]NVN00517.1 oxidoreductase [Arthrobacter sp. SDTb3-6]
MGTTTARTPLGSLGRKRRTGRSGPLLRTLIAAGVIGVLCLWWLGAPSAPAFTPAFTATSLGELSGMVGAFLVCVQVLLIARVPWFEHAVGMDRLVSWHRTLGSTVLFLIFTHVLLMVLGVQFLTSGTPWAATWEVLTSYPDMLTALIGTVLFLIIGISSARIPRSRISYEAWYWLHVTAYIAIFLTFFHELSAGVHFIDNPVNRAMWITLYVATASAVLTWRFILPAAAAWKHRLRVHQIVNEGDGINSVWLSGPHLDELGVRAGQFMFFRFVTVGHMLTSHPFSISRLPAAGLMRITVGALGDHSSNMHHLKPGTVVFAEGPFGHFTPEASSRHKVLLIAGGAGIGPIRALAQSLVQAGRDVVLVYRSTSHDRLALEPELRAMRPMVLHTVAGSRAELGHDPLGPQALKHLVKDISEREIYICGPEGMGITAETSLSALGIAKQLIHREILSMG